VYRLQAPSRTNPGNVGERPSGKHATSLCVKENFCCGTRGANGLVKVKSKREGRDRKDAEADDQRAGLLQTTFFFDPTTTCTLLLPPF